MKETEEEEIFKKVKDELSKHPIKLPPLDHMKAFAKLYHQERLKSSLPSEQEIDEQIRTYLGNSELAEAYKNGFQSALELLTKGDR